MNSQAGCRRQVTVPIEQSLAVGAELDVVPTVARGDRDKLRHSALRVGQVQPVSMTIDGPVLGVAGDQSERPVATDQEVNHIKIFRCDRRHHSAVIAKPVQTTATCR